jgi:hypothetical protein
MLVNAAPPNMSERLTDCVPFAACLCVLLLRLLPQMCLTSRLLCW